MVMMKMMKMMKMVKMVIVVGVFCLFFCCCCCCGFSRSTSTGAESATTYNGDEVLEVIVDGAEKLNNFSMIVNRFQVSLWKPSVKETGKCLLHVSSVNKQPLKDELQKAGIDFRIVIEDLQIQINRERESNPVEGVALPWMSSGGARNSRRNSGGRRRRRSEEEHSIVGKYATYEEICDWLRQTALTFPNVTRLEVIGRTYEGRDILLLKIGDERSALKKPGVWLDAGTHAREWITVSSAIYIISQILTDFYQRQQVGGSMEKEKEESMDLISSVDWFIVPVVNPDGYAFTHNGSRMWRKNRSFYGNMSYSETQNRTCIGTDINRNFNYKWNYYGWLNDSCLETFCGPWPSSENETQAIKTFLLAHNASIQGYVTIHSFGQLFMVRWAYNEDAPLTPEYNYTLAVANEAVEAINRTSGFIYQTGRSPEILYAFSGGSGDWVRANTPIRHAYDVELRDKGQLGFVLPADNIIPVGEEIWEAIKVVAAHVLEDHPPTTDPPPTTDHPATTDHPPTTDPPPTTDHPATTDHPSTTTTFPHSGGHQMRVVARQFLFLGSLVIVVCRQRFS